jgi:hypothetical protein
MSKNLLFINKEVTISSIIKTSMELF